MSRNYAALALSLILAIAFNGLASWRLGADGQLITCRGQFKGLALMLEIYRARFGQPTPSVVKAATTSGRVPAETTLSTRAATALASTEKNWSRSRCGS